MPYIKRSNRSSNKQKKISRRRSKSVMPRKISAPLAKRRNTTRPTNSGRSSKPKACRLFRGYEKPCVTAVNNGNFKQLLHLLETIEIDKIILTYELMINKQRSSTLVGEHPKITLLKEVNGAYILYKTQNAYAGKPVCTNLEGLDIAPIVQKLLNFLLNLPTPISPQSTILYQRLKAAQGRYQSNQVQDSGGRNPGGQHPARSPVKPAISGKPWLSDGIPPDSMAGGL